MWFKTSSLILTFKAVSSSSDPPKQLRGDPIASRNNLITELFADQNFMNKIKEGLEAAELSSMLCLLNPKLIADYYQTKTEKGKNDFSSAEFVQNNLSSQEPLLMDEVKAQSLFQNMIAPFIAKIKENNTRETDA